MWECPPLSIIANQPKEDKLTEKDEKNYTALVEGLQDAVSKTTYFHGG